MQVLRSENMRIQQELTVKKGLTKDGWNVMCNVSQFVIDIDTRMGHLYLPKMNFPDMRSTINCFTSADPECNAIHTYVEIGRAHV